MIECLEIGYLFDKSCFKHTKKQGEQLEKIDKDYSVVEKRTKLQEENVSI